MSDTSRSGTEHYTPEELVEEWRRRAGEHAAWDDYTEGIQDAFRACAEDLERSLNTGSERRGADE